MSDTTTASTQNRTGCYISHRKDKVLFAGPYQTADEYHAKILDKVLHGRVMCMYIQQSQVLCLFVIVIIMVY